MIPSGAPAALLACMYLCAATLMLCVPLLPLGLSPAAPLTPDLLFALTAAWVQRRPDSLPVFLILPVFLLADFILGRPPGLWTLLVLFVTEFLRLQASGQHDRPFVVEWVMVAGTLGGALFVFLLVLKLALAPHPAVPTLVELWAVTVATYPIIVFLLTCLFRVRAPETPSSDRLGGTL
ncbi:MAG: rod shape-determining protein MreD [Pseudomonadota bacterium]